MAQREQDGRHEAGRTPDFFREVYADRAPWDIGRPQPAVVELFEAGQIRGDVLDAGCGTGENAAFLAQRGHRVVAVDVVERAVVLARERARARGLDIEFHTLDLLELECLTRQFDTVLDAGVFHVFDDDQRPRYVAGLRRVVRPGGVYHTVVFSERVPGDEGPRRVTRRELHGAFADGWHVREIRESRYLTRNHPEGHHAWLASIERSR